MVFVFLFLIYFILCNRLQVHPSQLNWLKFVSFYKPHSFLFPQNVPHSHPLLGWPLLINRLDVQCVCFFLIKCSSRSQPLFNHVIKVSLHHWWQSPKCWEHQYACAFLWQAEKTSLVINVILFTPTWWELYSSFHLINYSKEMMTLMCFTTPSPYQRNKSNQLFPCSIAQPVCMACLVSQDRRLLCVLNHPMMQTISIQ